MSKITGLIKCSDFVKRQSPDSQYSHFDGSWEELEDEVNLSVSFSSNIRSGYREGVYLVDCIPSRFYSAIVDVNNKTKLFAEFITRRPDEQPYISVSSRQDKQKANYASVVLYHSSVLEEGKERSTSADWEIVAIKARVSEQEEPMDPVTMARNFLQLPGGTKGDFTAQQFAESIIYWSRHCKADCQKRWWETYV
jgi:hypothetical protein